MTTSLRPATATDLPFLLELLTAPEITRHLAHRLDPQQELAAEIERTAADPDAFGLLLIEEDGCPVGTATFECVNRRSRIASIQGVALSPTARGRGSAGRAVTQLCSLLFGELGFHRIQLETLATNEPAMRLFESVGFVREGTRRLAYWRDGRWVDGALYGSVLEDETTPPA